MLGMFIVGISLLCVSITSFHQNIIHRSNHPSISLFIHSSIQSISICKSIHPFIAPLIRPIIHPSLHSAIYLPIHQCDRSSIHPSVIHQINFQSIHNPIIHSTKQVSIYQSSHLFIHPSWIHPIIHPSNKLLRCCSYINSYNTNTRHLYTDFFYIHVTFNYLLLHKESEPLKSNVLSETQLC